MLNKSLIPTRLLDPSQRRKIVIVYKDDTFRFRGIRTLRFLLAFVVTILWWRLRGRAFPSAIGILLRTYFEQMGGLWLKVGQLLALRRDFFPMEFCSELSKLQDSTIAYPPNIIKPYVERELGGPLEDCFDHFEEMPFAAASIAQIHLAKLRNSGVWVAVKVQKPTAERLFLHDLSLIHRISLMIQWLGVLPHLRLRDLLWELQTMLGEELNFHYEESAMQRMRKLLRKHGIYVPRVYSRHTTVRLLVMEFIQGVLLSDLIQVMHVDSKEAERWYQENNVNPKSVAVQLFHSLFRQVLEDNLFHDDLHPANIILLRNSRIAFIDFGSVGSCEMDFLRKMRLFVEAIATKEYSKAIDLLFLLRESVPITGLDDIKQQCVRKLRNWETRNFTQGLPFRERSVATILGEVLRVLAKHRMAMEWAFMRIDRANLTIDAALMNLYPNANYSKLMNRYLRGSRKRGRQRRMKPREIGENLRSLVGAFGVLSKNISEYTLFHSPILRRNAMLFQGSTSKVAYFFQVIYGKLSFYLLFAEIILIGAFLQQYYPELLAPYVSGHIIAVLDNFPHLSQLIWIVVLILVAWSWRTATKLKKRFSQAEIVIPDARVAV